MRIRVSIDTTFVDSKNAGIAAKYLTSGEIALRDGLEIAISCLFTPLAVASFGGNKEKVESLIEVSRTQFETYMSLAMGRAENQPIAEDNENVLSDGDISLKQAEMVRGINLDEEEL